MDSKERNIVQKCQSGNNGHCGELYDLYIKKIYRYVYYKTLHKQTAEDITSEVFFKVLNNIHKFDAGRSFSAWIYSIARNAVVDHYRTFKRTENIEDVWDLKDDTDITEKIDQKIVFENVKSHLKNLSPVQREIIIMRIWHDMSYREIAEATGKSEVNCKVIFSRSISKLRKEALLTALILLALIK